MAVHIFTGNKIAVIWDFDQTLIPGYQQRPIFRRFGIDETTFWNEVNALPELYRRQQNIEVSRDTVYLCHMLSYVKAGRMPGLSNSALRELGAALEFYPGVPEFLETAKRHIEENERFRPHEIKVEYYVVSTGLRQMILGSKIAPYLDGVWACEFIEEVAQPGFRNGELARKPAQAAEAEISQIGYFLDNTTNEQGPQRWRQPSDPPGRASCTYSEHDLHSRRP